MKGMKIVVLVYFAQPEIRTFIESVRDTFHRCLQIRTVQHFIQKIILKITCSPQTCQLWTLRSIYLQIFWSQFVTIAGYINATEFENDTVMTKIHLESRFWTHLSLKVSQDLHIFGRFKTIKHICKMFDFLYGCG